MSQCQKDISSPTIAHSRADTKVNPTFHSHLKVSFPQGMEKRCLTGGGRAVSTSIVIFLLYQISIGGQCIQEWSLSIGWKWSFLQKSNNLFSKIAGNKFHSLE